MKAPLLRRSALYIALLACAPVLHAQNHADRDSAVDLDHVVVRATPLATTAEDLTRPVDVLSGERLDEAKASSLGETVSRLPGVQSSYFGPGVGRPVIRGFEGARVQVLSDGLGAGDVSTVSVDHAVSIEPFLAEQIEVLKGPATLLYGSGAIGGAVNVVEGRVPERATAEPLQGRAELRGGTVNDERTGMLRLDGTSASGHLVFHVDALHRETGDYRIPGFAESEAGHDEHEGEAGEEPGASGTLPNSALRTDSAAFGLSWVGARGFLGASQSLFNTRYGIPGEAHGHEDEEGEEGAGEEEAAVRIVMDQRRSEVRGGLDELGVFKSMRVKLARTDYTHTEFEGEQVGTVFDNDSTEARLELVHRAFGGWDGAIGLQTSRRNFEAVGAEAFVPSSRSRDTGIFWIGRREFGALATEVGARHDRNRIDVDPAEAIGPGRAFDTTSLSAAFRWNFSPDLHASFGLDRAQRSPTAEELYSNGLHVATGSLEVGSPDLDVETANRVELGMHWHRGPLTVSAAVYHVRYDDFIFLANATTDVEIDEPARLWTQTDARFTGAEAEVEWTFLENETGAWTARVFADAVRARLEGGGTRSVDVAIAHDDHVDAFTAQLALSGSLPRIAPARVGSELRWTSGAWRASLGAIRYARQDRVAENESATPGYTLVDAHLAWHLDTDRDTAWELFVDGHNLLDEEARVHTSFLKDFAPLPGRGVSFGVRAFF
ncbi:MAG: Zinc-regulated outer membrane receptor [uncultured Lysobacter sp.]|uniref:Zinc-regulated outer membrane receptor n=1 Tax=uncultured Lysobacter sp. TaxID=271060 RepID=A0A6J4MDP9_9GAMM|nr:MAG: Zinc-regulated outer membrane receptor [uncultured Lysobacter sp.]